MLILDLSYFNLCTGHANRDFLQLHCISVASGYLFVYLLQLYENLWNVPQ